MIIVIYDNNIVRCYGRVLDYFVGGWGVVGYKE